MNALQHTNEQPNYWRNLIELGSLPVYTIAPVNGANMKPGPKKKYTACLVDGCKKDPIAKGYCDRHYRRQKLHGDPNTVLVQRGGSTGTCSVDGCETKAHAKGFCSAHYCRHFKHGNPEAGRRIKAPFRRVCQIDGCERQVSTWGYCCTHYKRLLNCTPMDAPIRNWKGDGRYRTKEGYIRIVVEETTPGAIRAAGRASRGNGWLMMEHRYVMQQHLGRPMREDENVHHKNGIRDDNRIENLELWVTGQPRGQRVTDQLIWAREIIARYSSEVGGG